MVRKIQTIQKHKNIECGSTLVIDPQERTIVNGIIKVFKNMTTCQKSGSAVLIMDRTFFWKDLKFLLQLKIIAAPQCARWRGSEFGLITWRSGFLCVVFSDADLESMVTSERDLRRAKGERMKTQSAGNLVTWGFPNRGFLLLNFSVGTLPRYQEESLADIFPEKCPVTSKSDLMEPRKMRTSSAMDLGPIGPGYLEKNLPRLGHPREGKVLPSATSSTQMSRPEANSGFAAVLRADSWDKDSPSALRTTFKIFKIAGYVSPSPPVPSSPPILQEGGLMHLQKQFP